MPTTPNDARFALLIAVQTYADDELTNLGAPIRDAQALRKVLLDPAVGRFAHVDLLPDPTVREAMSRLEQFFTKCRPDDILVLHFGGHAFRHATSDKLYLAMSDTEHRDKPHSSALTGDFLLSVIEASPARRKLLVLDCCHSGAFNLTRAPDALGALGPTEARIADFGEGVERIVSRLPAPTVPATGTVVIGAARATEKAHESSRAGLLTEAVVDGLSSGGADLTGRGIVSTDDLFNYVTQRLDGHPDQHPVRHERDKSGSFIVAENPHRQQLRLPPKLVHLIESEDPGERLKAVIQLRKRVKSTDLDVARSALRLLRRAVDFDTDEDVRAHARLCAGANTLKAARTDIDVGTVVCGGPARTVDVAVHGPPLAAAWSVAGKTSEAVTAVRNKDLLTVGVDPSRPGPVDATVTLHSEAGEATVRVTARVATAVPFATRPAPLPDGPPAVQGRRDAALRGWAVAAAALLLIVATALTVVRLWPGETPWCVPSAELRILTSAQVRDAVQAAADSFTDSSAAASPGGCPSIHVTLNTTASDGVARDRLAGGWQDKNLLTVGPQPDVWLPESSVQVEWLRTKLDDKAATDASFTLPEASVHRAGVAGSPIVLAVPAGRKPAGRTAWSQLPARTGRIVRADPTMSSSGLLATRALYAALPRTDNARAAERVLTPNDGADMVEDLCLLRQQDSPPPADTAYLVPEKQVRDYNDGRPLGEGCPATGRAPAAHRLEAVRLSGDPAAALDLPCVVLRGQEWSDATQQALADSFCTFLRGPQGQGVLGANGFDGPAADTQLPESTPTGDVIDDWEAARRPWRVLLVMDVSGSMKLSVPGTQKRRMTVARQAAVRAVHRSVLRAEDQIGVWTFATKLVGNDDHKEELALQPAGLRHLEAVRQALDGIEPTDQNTGLHDTIIEGIRYLRAQPVAAEAPKPVNLIIVLTDGENDDPGSGSIDDVGAQLTGAGAEVQVSVIAAVGANCRPLRKLTEKRMVCTDDSRDGLDAAFAKVLPSHG